MFDVKDTDFFDLEDEAFDTIVENDITFVGNIKIEKTFMIRGQVTGNIDSISDLVIDSNAVVNADITADRILIKGKDSDKLANILETLYKNYNKNYKIKDISLYISHFGGGRGAVRDIIEQVLKAQDKWMKDFSCYIW